jgi:hypothetical protein
VIAIGNVQGLQLCSRVARSVKPHPSECEGDRVGQYDWSRKRSTGWSSTSPTRSPRPLFNTRDGGRLFDARGDQPQLAAVIESCIMT